MSTAPASASSLDPVALLLAEAKATLSFFQVSEEDQSTLAQQVMTEIGNPEVRQRLQAALAEDPFVDFDPSQAPAEAIQAARDASVAGMLQVVRSQIQVLEAMERSGVAWFVLRARLVELSQRIDQQMAAASSGT